MRMLLSMTEEQRWDSATLKVLINFFNSISLLGFSKIAHTCVLWPIERSHHIHTIETCKLPLISIKRFPNSNIRLFIVQYTMDNLFYIKKSMNRKIT